MSTTGERNTQERQGRTFAYGLSAGAKINRGAMVMLVAGLAQKGAAEATGVSVGIAAQSVDQAAGDTRVETQRGCFLFKNSAGADQIGLADVGSDCFIADDETVAKTNATNTRPKAGRVEEVGNDGVWVTI